MGSLTVIGTGIKTPAQTTLEARQAIERADRVVYVVADSVAISWITQLRPDAESLNHLYGQGKPRYETYEEMVGVILDHVRAGEAVCAVFYGHPGVFVYPSRRSIELARAEGFDATMQPGVSAEDCLFADLAIDPAAEGCQSYEATQFLARQPSFDTHTLLILWQIGVIGDVSIRDVEENPFNSTGLGVLVEFLTGHYGPDHPLIVYEAAQWAVYDPVIHHCTVATLDQAPVTPISTLAVLPKDNPPMNLEMLDRLGIPRDVGRLDPKLRELEPRDEA